MTGKRRIGGRKDRKILIISEDEKSFILYFEKLLQEIRYHKIEEYFKTESAGNKNGVITKIKLTHIGKTDTKNIVNKANKESSKYEKIFCVFDAENEEKLKKDLEIQVKQNVKKIISFPCYEAWLLMHFTTNLNEDKFQKINAADLITELSNQYLLKFGKEGLQFGTLVNYRKNQMSEQIFKWFYANLNTAKANAQRLRNENKKHLSTEIDLLINELENFSVA